MSLKQLPLASRPREKLLSHGTNALTDAELLAIFLRTGIKGMNALELATYLLQEFGSLRALLAADERGFLSGERLGSSKICTFAGSFSHGRAIFRRNFKKR